MITNASKVFHYQLSINEKKETEILWEQITDNPFNELIISWNAERPQKGYYAIYVSILDTRWSPWLPYAHWGSEEQQSFDTKTSDHKVSLFQDTLELLDGTSSMGFRVKVKAVNGAHLLGFEAIHAAASDLSYLQKLIIKPPIKSVSLKVPSLSQIPLPHKRAQHICSATSTTAALRFLLQNPAIDPVKFADKVWDKGFDIFGNWSFNVAQAYTVLGKDWQCWVARLTSFQDIMNSLSKKIPFVVSVKSPLPGSAKPYAEGHLVLVTGYDANHHRVMCMDPAFPTDSETQIFYAFEDFIPAWKRRNYIAYMFKPISS